MSERKVLNKYFPPDFDPSKIKRRKGVKDPQQTVRLMAPFSMRCNKCGEYIYKGKKFNARKETAQGEEYYGIKIFRFYIKCTLCSSEITFKTDPKNADYICEHGATRNFENWADADPTGRSGAMPDAAADDEYDEEGNPIEGSNAEKDAMADLERSQEQSRREMEMMDELADLRQRNARLELSNAAADPDSLLSALHAERESAEEEARRRAEQEEDDAMVAQYFAKIPSGPPGGTVPAKTKSGSSGKAKGKGKERAVDLPGGDVAAAGNGVDKTDEEGISSANGKGDNPDDDASSSASGSDGDISLPALTVKRSIPVSAKSNGNGIGSAEPSVASILAAKGKALDIPTAAPGIGAKTPAIMGATQVQVQAKRKREGMQKLLGIKRKAV